MGLQKSSYGMNTISRIAKNRLRSRCLTLVIALIFAGSVPVWSQNEPPSLDSPLETVVVLGTRTQGRSVQTSPAPIDVLDADKLSAQGETDLSNLLRNVIPSYSVADHPIDDAATLVRPINLRGLAPDHVLVLVNGQRRHRAAVITWLGNGISNGAQGPDIATIPALALQRIEVLRDGAAAQYGSDAIAGVINFELRKDSDGGVIEVRHGEYQAGDGARSTVSANVGLPLGRQGYLNLTGEWGESDPTSRSEQRADASLLDASGYPDVPNPAMIWGRPIVSDDIKLVANWGLALTSDIDAFGYANFSSRRVNGGFFYRNPTNRGGVYSNDDGETLLIGDLTPDDGLDCPVVALIGADQITPDPIAYAQVAADPNCFSFQELIPGGFTPRFGGDLSDAALSIGLRGQYSADLQWKLSAYYGRNESDFFILNTVNASMGPDTPRDFDPGLYRQVDQSLHLDVSYAASDAWNIGVGLEYRRERFTIGAGQAESYSAGPLAGQGFSTSSNGFPGFPASTSGAWSRANTAAYLDAEWTPTEALLAQFALRVEDFDTFGTTDNYKLGVNYLFSDDFGLRGTWSTGFKAPTPGQANASNTSTTFINVNGVPALINNGTIPSTSPVAQSVGGRELQPETSSHLSLGVFGSIGPFDITVDFYDVDVEDRLNLSSEITLTQAQIDQLIADNVPGADGLTQFRFFTNDFDTNTRGLDIVVSAESEWLGGTTQWSFAYNRNRTEIVRYNPETILEPRIRQVEDTTPKTRWNLTADHLIQDVRFLTRLSYYGTWYDAFEYDVFGTNAIFDSEIIVDVELEYDLTEASSVLFGGNNIFDNSGQKATVVNNLGFNSATVLGNTYSQYAPFGISGAFWYARYQYRF